MRGERGRDVGVNRKRRDKRREIKRKRKRRREEGRGREEGGREEGATTYLLCLQVHIQVLSVTKLENSAKAVFINFKNIKQLDNARVNLAGSEETNDGGEGGRERRGERRRAELMICTTALFTFLLPLSISPFSFLLFRTIVLCIVHSLTECFM